MVRRELTSLLLQHRKGSVFTVTKCVQSERKWRNGLKASGLKFLENSGRDTMTDATHGHLRIQGFMERE